MTSVILKIRDLTVADVERCLELNNAATPAVPHMERGGVIINLGSSGGKFGAAGRALYPASKAARQASLGHRKLSWSES